MLETERGTGEWWVYYPLGAASLIPRREKRQSYNKTKTSSLRDKKRENSKEQELWTQTGFDPQPQCISQLLTAIILYNKHPWKSNSSEQHFSQSAWYLGFWWSIMCSSWHGSTLWVGFGSSPHTSRLGPVTAWDMFFSLQKHMTPDFGHMSLIHSIANKDMFSLWERPFMKAIISKRQK